MIKRKINISDYKSEHKARIVRLCKQHNIGPETLSDIDKLSIKNILKLKILLSLPLFPNVLFNFRIKGFLEDSLLQAMMEITDEYFPETIKNKQHLKFLGINGLTFLSMKRKYEMLLKKELSLTQMSDMMDPSGDDAQNDEGNNINVE